MNGSTVRIPIPPNVLITLLLVTLLLYAAFLIAPDSARLGLLVCAGLMVALIAFTSVELTLYLLILSTLLSPELTFGGQQHKGGVIKDTNASRGVTLRLDDILLTIICVTWMFRMAVSKELGVMRKTPLNRPFLWYWMWTLLATTAGFYAGRVKPFGFFFVVKYLEYFVMFYMVVNQIHDKAVIRRYVMVMLFTCFVASLVGIAQIPSGERVSAPFEGVEGEPNTFGGYLELMFAVTLGLFLHEPEGTKRWRWLVLMGVILPPFGFTESRASYLAFMAMIGYFLLFAEKKRFILGCCMTGAALAPFVLPANVVNRIMYTFAQPREAGQMAVGGVHVDTSTSARLQSWLIVIQYDVPTHPVLGFGVTGSRFMDAQYPRVLSETGVVGLLLFIWMLRSMWNVFREGYRRLRDPLLRGVSLGSLCGYGGLLFHALGSNSFIIVRVMEPLMILLALVTAALLIEQREEASQSSDKAGMKLSASMRMAA